jgi:hypothetical protein
MFLCDGSTGRARATDTAEPPHLWTALSVPVTYMPNAFSPVTDRLRTAGASERQPCATAATAVEREHERGCGTRR